MFTLNESIFLLTIIIIGGLASFRGAIVGTIFVFMLPEVLRFVGLSSELAAQTRLLVFGLVLMYLMHAKPTGLFGKYLP
jgi:branched-chain amino acid transport system permease protein